MTLCDPRLHLSRRRLFGTVGGSLFLPTLADRLAADTASDPARPKSVILLWMEGGPSQLETFDPHAGTKIGGDVREIETSSRGVQIADTLPRTAEQMHLATLIRSMTSEEGDHARAIYNAKTGFRLDPTLRHPSLGAVLTASDQTPSELPRHISILAGQHAGRGGYLGARYDAFRMGDPAGPVPDIQASVDEERLDRRMRLLRDVAEPSFRRGRLKNLEMDRTLHEATTMAAKRMMSSDQLKAFEVDDEPKAVLDAFGDTAFGRGTLAASRLIEHGARCVEVTLGGWDSHVTNDTLQRSACETLDPALAALLARLEERDRLRDTLVVCAGEFGRTPQINPAEGRDHWPHGFSVLLAGGGFGRGRVHGATAADPKLDADDPRANLKDPVAIEDLHATVLNAMGIDPAFEEETPIGRPLKRSEGRILHELLDA